MRRCYLCDDADYASDWQDDESYTYDDNGNRTNDGYDTGDHNRLLEDGTYHYQYDEEGNRTLRFVDDGDDEFGEDDTLITVYTWDHRNRLTSVAEYEDYEDYGEGLEGSSLSVEYTYDAFNQLIYNSGTIPGDNSGGQFRGHNTDIDTLGKIP